MAQAFALIRQDERQRQGYTPGPNSSTTMMANSGICGKNKLIYGPYTDHFPSAMTSYTNMETNPSAYGSSSGSSSQNYTPNTSSHPYNSGACIFFSSVFSAYFLCSTAVCF